MKTRNLLVTIGVATLATITINATASNALLSPRAAGNQIKVVSSATKTPTINVAYVDTMFALLSPRDQGNQIKVIKGIANDTNPALECIRSMNGTPRTVAECASHAAMPVCNSVNVAPLK